MGGGTMGRSPDQWLHTMHTPTAETRSTGGADSTPASSPARGSLRAAPVRATARTAARCSSCSMRALCMPQGLSPDELTKLEALICTARSVQRGEALYRSGDRFDNVYAVRSGSMKTVMAHRDGREQVTGLCLAGEALGLDGISE